MFSEFEQRVLRSDRIHDSERVLLRELPCPDSRPVASHVERVVGPASIQECVPNLVNQVLRGTRLNVGFVDGAEEDGRNIGRV